MVRVVEEESESGLPQLSGFLSANLETRRRRKDTQRKNDPVDLSESMGSPAKTIQVRREEEEPVQIQPDIRQPGKRKLDPKEQRTPVLNRTSSKNDVFVFSRKEEPVPPMKEIRRLDESDINLPLRSGDDIIQPSPRKALATSEQTLIRRYKSVSDPLQRASTRIRCRRHGKQHPLSMILSSRQQAEGAKLQTRCTLNLHQRPSQIPYLPRHRSSHPCPKSKPNR